MGDIPIDQVSFYLQSSRRKEVRAFAFDHLKAAVQFFQDNDLLTRRLIEPDQGIDESFGFYKSDLTIEGWSLVQRCYDRWLGAIDRGASPTDVSMLDRELKKMRGSAKTKKHKG